MDDVLLQKLDCKLISAAVSKRICSDGLRKLCKSFPVQVKVHLMPKHPCNAYCNWFFSDYNLYDNGWGVWCLNISDPETFAVGTMDVHNLQARKFIRWRLNGCRLSSVSQIKRCDQGSDMLILVNFIKLKAAALNRPVVTHSNFNQNWHLVSVIRAQQQYQNARVEASDTFKVVVSTTALWFLCWSRKTKQARWSSRWCASCTMVLRWGPAAVLTLTHLANTVRYDAVKQQTGMSVRFCT